MSEAPEARARPPRWDPDERGVGVGDGRGHVARLDALRTAAAEDSWVAEEPEAHLLPHILRHVGDGTSFSIEGTTTEPDGTFLVDLRWTGPAEVDRRTVRAAAYALIGVIAEGMTGIAEERGPDGAVFEVVTGMLADQTEFASHGHTLRLTIEDPPATGPTAGTDA